MLLLKIEASFNALYGPTGSLVVGSPEHVTEKLKRHSDALGGVDRFTFQMDNAALTHHSSCNQLTYWNTGYSAPKIILMLDRCHHDLKRC